MLSWQNWFSNHIPVLILFLLDLQCFEHNNHSWNVSLGPSGVMTYYWIRDFKSADSPGRCYTKIVKAHYCKIQISFSKCLMFWMKLALLSHNFMGTQCNITVYGWISRILFLANLLVSLNSSQLSSIHFSVNMVTIGFEYISSLTHHQVISWTNTDLSIKINILNDIHYKTLSEDHGVLIQEIVFQLILCSAMFDLMWVQMS